jgi:hypothetical protein
MGSDMNEQSIVKRTLVLTGKLLGISVLWIALLSFVTVFATGRAVSALSSGSAEKGASAPAESASESAKKDPAGAVRAKNVPANAPNKPNG